MPERKGAVLKISCERFAWCSRNENEVNQKLRFIRGTCPFCPRGQGLKSIAEILTFTRIIRPERDEFPSVEAVDEEFSSFSAETGVY